MIPIRAVHVAREQLYEMGVSVSPKYIMAALEAAEPHMLQELLDFADERDEALGAIRSHITTYELRKILGVEE